MSHNLKLWSSVRRSLSPFAERWRCGNWISELIFSLPFPIMYTQPAIQRKQPKGSALFIVFFMPYVLSAYFDDQSGSKLFCVEYSCCSYYLDWEVPAYTPGSGFYVNFRLALVSTKLVVIKITQWSWSSRT